MRMRGWKTGGSERVLARNGSFATWSAAANSSASASRSASLTLVQRPWRKTISPPTRTVSTPSPVSYITRWFQISPNGAVGRFAQVDDGEIGMCADLDDTERSGLAQHSAAIDGGHAQGLR